MFDDLAFMEPATKPKPPRELRKNKVMEMGVNRREWLTMKWVFAEDGGVSCPWYREYAKNKE